MPLVTPLNIEYREIEYLDTSGLDLRGTPIFNLSIPLTLAFNTPPLTMVHRLWSIVSGPLPVYGANSLASYGTCISSRMFPSGSSMYATCTIAHSLSKLTGSDMNLTPLAFKSR